MEKPEDAEIDLVNTTIYFTAVYLFPSRFTEDEYENAVAFLNFSREDQEAVVENARNILGQTV